MARAKESANEQFEDPHFVEGYIKRRLAQLQSGEPVGDGLEIGREGRDAIVGFVRARRGEVGSLRIRTYLSWLPLAAAKLGPTFLDPTKQPPIAFNEAFPP